MQHASLHQLALLSLLAPTQVPAQAAPTSLCNRITTRVEILDSVDARLGADLSTQGERSLSCALVHLGRDSVLVVAVAGADERTGGIAVVSPRGDTLLYVLPYPAARDILAAGTSRVLFTYTEAQQLLGAGIYESHYVVLCALSREAWLPCLTLTRDHIDTFFSPRRTVKIEEHNVAELIGDSVRYSRRAVVDTTSQDLGTVMLALPHVP